MTSEDSLKIPTHTSSKTDYGKGDVKVHPFLSRMKKLLCSWSYSLFPATGRGSETSSTGEGDGMFRRRLRVV